MCIYNFLTLYTNKNAIYTFCISEKGEGGERDLGEWRARSERVKRGEQNICVYTIFSALYN